MAAPAAPKHGEMTLGELVELHKASISGRSVRNRRDTARVAAYLFEDRPASKDRALSEFEHADFAAWYGESKAAHQQKHVRTVVKTKSPGVVATWHARKSMVAIFNYGLNELHLKELRVNPAVTVEAVHGHSGRRRTARFARARAPHWPHYFMLVANTGTRLDEWLGAKWKVVDFGRKVLSLPDSKTGLSEE
jgi:integrase